MQHFNFIMLTGVKRCLYEQQVHFKPTVIRWARQLGCVVTDRGLLKKRFAPKFYRMVPSRYKCYWWMFSERTLHCLGRNDVNKSFFGQSFFGYTNFLTSLIEEVVRIEKLLFPSCVWETNRFRLFEIKYLCRIMNYSILDLMFYVNDYKFPITFSFVYEKKFLANQTDFLAPLSLVGGRFSHTKPQLGVPNMTRSTLIRSSS